METPQLRIEHPPAIPLAEAVLHHAGWRETVGDTRLERRPDDLYARYIGCACVEACKERIKPAKGYIGRSRRIKKEQLPEPHTPREIRNDLLDIYGDIIHHRKNLNAFTRARDRFYAASLAHLQHAYGHVNPARCKRDGRTDQSEWVGLTNELTALCLLNRRRYPGMIALPALKHHDLHGTFLGNSHDIAAIIAVPEEEHNGQQYGRATPTEMALLDIKSSPSREWKRPERDERALLVNARKYFGYQSEAESVEDRFPVTTLLCREYGQDSHEAVSQSPEGVHLLDTATDQLIHDVYAHAFEQRTVLPRDFTGAA